MKFIKTSSRLTNPWMRLADLEMPGGCTARQLRRQADCPRRNRRQLRQVVGDLTSETSTSPSLFRRYVPNSIIRTQLGRGPKHVPSTSLRKKRAPLLKQDKRAVKKTATTIEHPECRARPSSLADDPPCGILRRPLLPTALHECRLGADGLRLGEDDSSMEN